MKKILNLRKKVSALENRPEKTTTSSNFVIPHPKYDFNLPIAINWLGPITHRKPDQKAIIITVVLIFFIGVLFQIFEKNVITAIFFLALGIVLLLQIGKKPIHGEVEINATSVKIANRKYNYSELGSFWIDYRPEENIEELSLESKKWYLPYIKVSIANRDPVQIRAFLVQFIPEMEHKENLSEIIVRRLGL